MLLALATCDNLPTWEVDDEPLHAALREADIAFERPSWRDPAIDWARYDAVTIRTTWDYQFHHEEYVAWAKRVGSESKLINPVDVVIWNTRKTYLRDLQAYGALVTPSIWLEPRQSVDLASVLSVNGWSKAMLKPVVGATARETFPFTDSGLEIQQAQQHLARLLEQEPMILQPYLNSVETFGELSAIFLGGEFSHAVQKIPQPGDYRVQDDFGANDRPYTLSSPERKCIDDCMGALERYLGDHLPGQSISYARVDMLRNEAGELCLNELELVEPSLFFRHSKSAATLFIEAIRGALA